MALSFRSAVGSHQRIGSPGRGIRLHSQKILLAREEGGGVQVESPTEVRQLRARGPCTLPLALSNSLQGVEGVAVIVVLLRLRFRNMGVVRLEVARRELISLRPPIAQLICAS